MKSIYLPVKYNFSEFKIKEKNFNSLPRNIVIAYSIQYQGLANQVKKLLAKNHKITAFLQVLGCSSPKLSKNTQAILLISEGKFHAVSLAYETKLPVFLFNKAGLSKISNEDVLALEKKQKGAYVKYLHSDVIGVIVSAKPGQQRLTSALKFIQSNKDKIFYLFLSNNINPLEFENFPQIQSWVNTACPRMDMSNSKTINLNKISKS